MAACAKLLDLSLEETLNAFGIAGASAPVAHAGKFGWHDKSISFVKDNVALPAEAGLRAALLAQRGYEGSESILDGDRGYWVMAGSDRCDFNRLTELSEFEIMGVSLKPYPCCRWIHTTLDVLNGFINEYQPDLSDILKIEVFSIEPVAEFFGKKIPRTFVDMEFSIPCCVALKLHRIPHSQWFEERHWNDSKTLELASKVELTLDEEYQDLYLKLSRQSARIPTRIEITLKGGKRFNGYSDDAWGSPTKPMNREERLHKIRDLLGEHIPFDTQDEFIHWTDHLEDVDNISTVTGLLRCS
jgi:2-methylcitrate dehydratase PrpD